MAERIADDPAGKHGEWRLSGPIRKHYFQIANIVVLPGCTGRRLLPSASQGKVKIHVRAEFVQIRLGQI